LLYLPSLPLLIEVIDEVLEPLTMPVPGHGAFLYTGFKFDKILPLPLDEKFSLFFSDIFINETLDSASFLEYFKGALKNSHSDPRFLFFK
jgi:hypothetical protein